MNNYQNILNKSHKKHLGQFQKHPINNKLNLSSLELVL